MNNLFLVAIFVDIIYQLVYSDFDEIIRQQTESYIYF